MYVCAHVCVRVSERVSVRMHVDIMRVRITDGLLYLKTTLHVSLCASALFSEQAPVLVHQNLGDRAPIGAPHPGDSIEIWYFTQVDVVCQVTAL